MEKLKKVLYFLLGLLVLDVFFNYGLISFSTIYGKLAVIVGFFPLAYGVSKASGLNGFRDLGVFLHEGWLRNFVKGFAAGFMFWCVYFGGLILHGDISIMGVKPLAENIMPFLVIAFGFFMGSFINDIIVRGYVIGHLKDRMPLIWAGIISVAVYTLDDAWHAGFSWNNTLFSIILGASLTLAFIRSGSIWANTGIHYGLNMCYGLFFGLVGSQDGGILIVKEKELGNFEDIYLLFTASLLLGFVYLSSLFKKVREKDLKIFQF
jgi:membrane protease YdiL (CAAX protease family)